MCATIGSIGEESAPSMKQLMLSKATASEAGLFLMVERNSRTLPRDMTTTVNRAVTRGTHASPATHMIIETKRDKNMLNKLRRRATVLRCLKASPTMNEVS